MKVCGVDLKGSEAIVIVLEGLSDNFEIIDTGVTKVVLGDTNKSEDINTFKDTFHSFIRNHNIDHIGIKKRNAKGKFAGGPTGFKMEGLIQLTPNSNIALLPPTTISSTVKKNPPPKPDGIFGYQKNAYEIAYSLLRSI
jgi:hypothetical protein